MGSFELKSHSRTQQVKIDHLPYFMNETLEVWCRLLPKLELHAHLNGSIRISTILEFLSKYRENQNDESDEFSKFLSEEANERSLEACFNIFDLIHEQFSTRESICRITREVIEDFDSENVLYLELRTTPRNVGTMTKRCYLEAVLEAIDQCRKLLSIQVGLLLSINRAESIENSLETVNLAAEFKGNIVLGVDLSGNPNRGSVDEFLPVLFEARRHGLKVSVHIGEIANFTETEKILQWKPDRIAHAVVLDERSKSLLFENPIPLELCLTSNVRTHSVNSYENHHFREFYRKDYPICLCTDDRGIFNTSLSKEYLIAADVFHLKKEEIFQLAFNAINFLFVTEEIKQSLRNDFLRRKESLLGIKECPRKDLQS